MYKDIIENNLNVVVFGFIGILIFEKNVKYGLIIESNFGLFLYKYIMKNGIEDKKVLGFSCDYKFIDKVLFFVINIIDSDENDLVFNFVNVEIKFNSFKNLINVKDEELLNYEENFYNKIKNSRDYKE